MDIIRLPVGETPPLDVDCLRIEEQPGGLFALTGSALRVDGDEAESVSLIGGPQFTSRDAAEAAGIAWAADLGIARLVVGTGTLREPLELTEIDLPLHGPAPE